jgi:acyl-coenzyme A thioesterase PaaI-like protein
MSGNEHEILAVARRELGGRIVDVHDKIYAHGTATCMVVDTPGL